MLIEPQTGPRQSGETFAYSPAHMNTSEDARQEAVQAVKALRGMFADEASLEGEFLLVREKETW